MSMGMVVSVPDLVATSVEKRHNRWPTREDDDERK